MCENSREEQRDPSWTPNLWDFCKLGIKMLTASYFRVCDVPKTYNSLTVSTMSHPQP